MKPLPKAEDYVSTSGAPLRELFALAVLRSLSPMEREGVLRSLKA